MVDAHKNFAYTLVDTAPAPADSGTSLTVTAGTATRFPATPFNATVCAEGEIPVPTNAEIVRVTNISGDTLTIEREQEGTTARSIVTGDQIFAAVTVKTLTDVEEAVSVISQALSVVSTAASHALSVALVASALASAADAHASTASAAATSVDARVNALSQAVSVISQQVSVLSNQNSVEHAALSARIDLGGGTASVTSNELSAVSNTASVERASIWTAVSILRSALSVRSVGDVSTHGMQSILNALSTRISHEHSVASQAISVTSAAVTSVDARVNTVSNLVSALTSAHNALSNVVSGVVSGASARSVGDVSTHGFQSIVNALSGRISHAMSVASQAVSVTSAAVTSVDARVNTVSNLVSALTSAHNALSNVASGTASAVNNVSATSAGGGSATGLQNVIDALSNKISTIVAGAVSVTSAEYVSTLSVVSHLASIVSNVSAQSAGGSATGLQAVINLLSNKISQAGGGGGSVTSDEVSAVSQTASVNLNARAPWLAAAMRVVGNTQSVALSALTDISGLVITVAAGEVWKIEGLAMLSTSAVGAGLRLGFSVPPLSAPTGFIRMAGQSAASQANNPMIGHQPAHVSGSSVTLSITSVGTAGVVFGVNIDAVMNVASAGTIRLQMAAIASAAQSPMHILKGSHLIGYRLI